MEWRSPENNSVAQPCLADALFTGVQTAMEKYFLFHVFLKKHMFMGKLLLFFLPVLFVHAWEPGRTAPVPKPTPAIQAKAFDPKDWLIDEATARKMMDHYRNCSGGKCREFKKRVVNEEARDYIEQTYTIVSSEVRMARYDDDDVERYRRARNLDAADPRGDVSGFSTTITLYRVLAKSGSLDAPVRTLYADNYTICPPPDNPPCTP